MKFIRPIFRSLAMIAAGLLALVACQNATDSNSSNSGSLKAIATLIDSHRLLLLEQRTHHQSPDSGAVGHSKRFSGHHLPHGAILSHWYHLGPEWEPDPTGQRVGFGWNGHPDRHVVGRRRS
jgi:hypothetical protein